MRINGFTTAAALSALLIGGPAFIPSAHAEQSSVKKEAKKEAKVAEVRAAQTKLKALGYYDDAIDGVWGPATEQAVRKYQKAENLKVNGKLNSKTSKSLGVDGDLHASDSKLEGKGERAGEKAGREVGKAADKTADAVADTGEAAGKGMKKGGKEVSKAAYPVDKGFDKAGDAAGSGLEKGLDKAGDGVEAAVEGTGKGIKKAGEAVADVFDGDKPKTEVTTNEKYDTRQTATMTRHAQEKLKDKGFYTGDVDGMMGPATEEALKDFQRKNNLSVTGRLDSKTIDKLDLD